MRGYKDRTAEKAISSASREWRYMADLAVRIREGGYNPLWVEEQSAKFTGIYKRLLEDPISEVRKEAGR